MPKDTPTLLEILLDVTNGSTRCVRLRMHYSPGYDKSCTATHTFSSISPVISLSRAPGCSGDLGMYHLSTYVRIPESLRLREDAKYNESECDRQRTCGGDCTPVTLHRLV